MKKLLFLLIMLFFIGCGKWEYTTYVSEGKEYNRTGVRSSSMAHIDPKEFDLNLDMEKLNELGKQGWEVVNVYTTEETQYPDMGNENIILHIKTNTRTKNIVYLLKRKI